ncbi:MAG: FkbM family methyltransferase [Chlorobaculum sp.]|nr:FkbM family methyltransferase [Chlorobaculum sp.]
MFRTGGWIFSPIGINSSSVVFSLGVAHDYRFDKGIIDNFACHVHAFDSTPGGINWISAHNSSPEFRAYHYAIGSGISDSSRNPRIEAKESSASVWHSLVGKFAGKDHALSRPAKRISTVMSEIGVDSIDLLKMDIGAAAYDIIDDILESGITVYQLLVEFNHRFKTVPVEKTKAVLEKLYAAGYRIFYIGDRYRKFSFIDAERYRPLFNESLKLP